MAVSRTFRIFRYDPVKDPAPYWSLFTVNVEQGDSVLTGLMKIREELDGSLAFRASCRSGICGSDGMVINGRSRLACKTQVDDMGHGEVVIEPLRNLPYLKDLVVDQTPFWDKFESVMPWLHESTTEPVPETERRMTLAEDAFDDLSKASDCIFCQICYAECPVNGLDRAFIGPQALIKAFRFEADPRDVGTNERVPILDQPDGVWRCRTTFNCTVSCPKGIPITKDIQSLKREMVGTYFHARQEV
ncbi:MAG: succinate dehydrogenase iron-sulfur subunit [Sulfobacillus benefaciens]|uniref:succinate dehydrogenase n=1 Tax=Sulfobacillus benefaciens TaxID=453960 RepID=A0A2T2XHW4_9FIRM|nr:MAG: succinate dehydrogenase iron-sulfur subunit [Sulfobacillus benefaciens]